MSLATLLNRPCTITHVTQTGAPDVYGNPTNVETTITTVCFAEQRRASEDTSLEDTQIESWLVVLPAGTIVAGPDRITLDDMVLEVQGPPDPLFNPRAQAVSHIECIAKRVV